MVFFDGDPEFADLLVLQSIGPARSIHFHIAFGEKSKNGNQESKGQYETADSPTTTVKLTRERSRFALETDRVSGSHL